MFLTNIFKFGKNCQHNKINPDIDFGYCPDCGKMIKNNWYITRCACCGVKMRAIIHNGEVMPQNNYCANCGSREYKVELLPQINFIDINFAVLQKKIVEVKEEIWTTQCWQEKNIEKPKLLKQYL